MIKTVINIENISKLYRLGEIGTGTLSHDLNRWWARVRGRDDPTLKIGKVNDRTSSEVADYIWALKDINLEIKEGDIVGFIGRNGAGKSTLLKLISRITKPTEGTIRINGRIASLLEVGTGMHPEMTARENIYLNGSILGMRRKEIRKQFDEIIEFAGCSLYVDTPIKRFSSGMRVRLGFAIAAHLQPDILVIDEVLAVGDIEFQQKCLGKMESVNREEGRTVLFVSHNMAAISSLTKRSVLLDQGRIIATGDTDRIIALYTEKVREKYIDIPVRDRTDRKGNGKVKIVDISIIDESGHTTLLPLSPERKKIILDIECNSDAMVSSIATAILSSSRERIFRMESSDQIESLKFFRGKYRITLNLAGGTCAAPGDYYINVGVVGFEGMLDYVADAYKFSITNGDFYGKGKAINVRSSMVIEHDWQVETISGMDIQ